MGFYPGGNYPYNPMYDMGYHRVGCIGCPMATYKQKMKEFADFPYVKELYIKAFDKMLIRNPKAQGEWKTGEDVYKWWIEENKHITQGQMSLSDLETDADGFIVREPRKEKL